MMQPIEVVLGAILECVKAKFADNFTVCALDNMEAILGNIFLDAYHIDVLKDDFKLKVIPRLIDKSISLEI